MSCCRRQFDQNYVVEDLGSTAIPLYHADGAKVFRRHRLNNRVQMAVRRSYTELILKEGLIKDARAGKVVVVPDTLDRDSWVLHQIGAATLVEALYDAHDQQPENAQVKASVDDGIAGVIILNPRTPTDCLEYIRDELNKMVGVGARTSFLEHYNIVPAIENQWVEHRRAKPKNAAASEDAPADSLEDSGSTATTVMQADDDDDDAAAKQQRSQAGYEKSYFDFVAAKWPARFASFSEFDSAKRSLSGLRASGVYDTYVSYCNQHVAFGDRQLSSRAVYRINLAIVNMFDRSPQHAQRLASGSLSSQPFAA